MTPNEHNGGFEELVADDLAKERWEREAIHREDVAKRALDACYRRDEMPSQKDSQ